MSGAGRRSTQSTPCRRGNSNRNQRGNTRTRRLRRQWLLDHFGDGVTAPCAMCGRRQDIDSISVDCHPIPRCDGGTYKIDNIRPGCDPCQSRQGGQLAQARRRARLERAST